MASHSYIGLPLIPPDLKPISPFLQRAEEVKIQDPIISYWCAYYAAQVGIGLKAPAPANRAFLSTLLTTLESLRASIGPTDAVDVESASTAYVENFALRVFTSADNDDRAGHATRVTAKKFLAAATFFELLRVFDDKTAFESHEDKIRYAKWKAADIAKALREGRTPAPGPAGGEAAENTSTAALETALPPSTVNTPAELPTQPQDGEPPRMSSTIAQAQNQRFQDIKLSATAHEAPGHWSTQATTGGAESRLESATELPGRSSGTNSRAGTHSGQGSDRQEGREKDELDDLPSRDHFSSTLANGHANGSRSSKDYHFSPSDVHRTGSTSSKSHRSSTSSSSSKHSKTSSSSRHRTTSLSAATAPGRSMVSGTDSKRNRVVSMVLGSTPQAGDPSPPMASAPVTTTTSPTSPPPATPNSAVTTAPEPPRVASPTHFVPRTIPNIPISPSQTAAMNINRPGPFSPSSSTLVGGGSPPNGGIGSHAAGIGLSSSPPYVPPVGNIYSASGMHNPYSPAPSQRNVYASAPPPPPPPPIPPKEPSPPPELTPVMIAKAQKHCRFAISALDYEDAEQARKELRAALAVLGE